MKLLNQTTFLSALGMAVVLSIPAAHAASPQAAKDDSYVTVAGTVAAIGSGDEFELNYGTGSIKVDTNDAWPNLFKTEANNAGKYLKEGDHVVVNGIIDDNWFARKEIDAHSLRFQNGGQIISYNRDEKNHYNLTDKDNALLKDEGTVRVSGVISRVEDSDSYILRTSGQGTLEIDASDIAENTRKSIKTGDRVVVTGELDETLFNEREIEATSLERVGASQRSSL